jgi:hypothetical protein
LCLKYKEKCLTEGPTAEIVNKWLNHFESMEKWCSMNVPKRTWHYAFIARQMPGLWKCMTLTGMDVMADELKDKYMRYLKIEFGEDYELK